METKAEQIIDQEEEPKEEAPKEAPKPKPVAKAKKPVDPLDLVEPDPVFKTNEEKIAH